MSYCYAFDLHQVTLFYLKFKSSYHNLSYQLIFNLLIILYSDQLYIDNTPALNVLKNQEKHTALNDEYIILYNKQGQYALKFKIKLVEKYRDHNYLNKYSNKGRGKHVRP